MKPAPASAHPSVRKPPNVRQSQRCPSPPGSIAAASASSPGRAINDGIIAVPAEVKVGMDPDEVARTLTARFRPAQPHVTIGAYLVEHRGSRTLIDTGARALMGPTLGRVVANLRSWASPRPTSTGSP